MSELFQKSRSTINEHILNIYKEGELAEDGTLRKIGNSDFSVKPTKYYNLDVIISVGYRVKSQQGTQFRIWVTQRLKEYIVKGFALNDERFKSGSSMNYFNELQERIRHIRLSERFFYQKIKDIYTTSIDYSAPRWGQSGRLWTEVILSVLTGMKSEKYLWLKRPLFLNMAATEN